MQKKSKKALSIERFTLSLHQLSGFVKILEALVKSSLVFVLVEGGHLTALKFFQTRR